MTHIQRFYLSSYRLVGFVFLSGLIVAILWYGFAILFFIGNSSWAIPMVLSANQEKVMAHREHLMTFEHRIIKNKAEIVAAEQALIHKKKLLIAEKKLWQRLDQGIASQSIQDTNASDLFNHLSQESEYNVSQFDRIMHAVNIQENDINKELKNGLITKQEALLAQINIHKITSALTDSKINMYNLRKRSQDYANAAKTLSGSNDSLKTMDKLIKKVELENQISQLKSDIFSLNINIKHLKKIVNKEESILASMVNNPYIIATKKPSNVAFIPYRNLTNLKVGAPVFSCYFDMIFCYKSGQVLAIYEAEEYNKHPIFKSDVKGKLLSIAFNRVDDTQRKLLFIRSKPLFI